VAQRRIGVAIFGAGRWGTHLIRNFLQQPGAQIVAIVDPHCDRLNSVVAQLGVPPSVILASDWQTALQLPDIEAVAIATPAITHTTLIQAALTQGYHVLAEKPLTLDPLEAAELCHLAERCQRQLVVDHTYLFHPAVQQGRAIVQHAKLGDLYYGYAARTHLGPVRQDVDALWDLAIHDIAIFNHWLQEIPIRVQAQGTCWLQPHLGDEPRFPHGLADLVWIKLVYPSGLQAMLHLCWLNPDKQRRLCLTGSKGTLIFDELAASPLLLRQGQFDRSHQQFHPIDQKREAIAVEATEPLQQVCAHFLDCVRHNTPSPDSSGWTGVQLVQVLDALTRSLNQGGQLVEVPRSGIR
jgi:predicted dehydrogenase